MSNVSVEHAKEVMAYFYDYGETKTLKKYNISSETLHRYKRKLNFFKRRNPRVLLFDIETVPLETFVWHTGKQRISHEQIKEDWNIISWAAKWLYSPEVFSETQTPKEAKQRNDKRIVKSLWGVFEQAEIIIGHNAENFDIRKSNARFILNGLKPPSPYQTIDTLKMSRKIFSFSSYKLDYLGQLFTNKGKIKTDYGLWLRCLRGEQEALNYMQKYNEKDVLLLEEVYIELRPWIKSHPNLAIYAECTEETCPACLSTNLIECGDYVTPAGRFDSLRCSDCGAIMRRRKSNQGHDERKSLLLSASK